MEEVLTATADAHSPAVLLAAVHLGLKLFNPLDERRETCCRAVLQAASRASRELGSAATEAKTHPCTSSPASILRVSGSLEASSVLSSTDRLWNGKVFGLGLPAKKEIMPGICSSGYSPRTVSWSARWTLL